WRVARGELALSDFLAEHGYHSTGSGELCGRAWREDPRPVEQLLGAVRSTEDPAQRRRRAASEAARVTASVLDALPAHTRLTARGLLRLAPRTVRALELTKVSFLLCGDGGRA